MVGDVMRGEVTGLVTFGSFVRVSGGIEGLVHSREFAPGPVTGPHDVVQIGDEMVVVVTGVDRRRRTLPLSPGCRPSPDSSGRPRVAADERIE
ncbi:S1 RNA-binding domain-containing protein [Streptomyces sp. JH34]|uniref:S1 RNA-binding domain-containing protein n=1 Tax=Streptomyces sp. JH34 TaxID=2793633 RepID=UPI0023F829A0|nr:S1 RNA-binding domain-containing protein [Streptomyces sp. JH34]MDF6022957.1 S1 RNA-binding domain-containing protein [Streptomyces sp. JH34]